MRSIWKFLISLLVGFLCVAGIALTKDIFSQTEPVKVYHILCDAFFAVGVVMFNFGLLIFTTNEGVFDMAVYGLQSFFDLFRKHSMKKYETFYDYRMSRADKKLKFGFLLISGAILLAVSLIMYCLYRQYA